MTHSRILECVECGDPVEVFEIPIRHLDPRLYVCGECLKPATTQGEITDGPRIETVQYNPQQAEVPF